MAFQLASMCVCASDRNMPLRLSPYADTVILLGHLLATLSPPQQGIVGEAENGQNKSESSTSSSLCCNEMITTQSSSSWIMLCAHWCCHRATTVFKSARSVCLLERLFFFKLAACLALPSHILYNIVGRENSYFLLYLRTLPLFKNGL